MRTHASHHGTSCIIYFLPKKKEKKIIQSQRRQSKVCEVLNGQNVPCSDTEGTDKHSPLLNSNPKFIEQTNKVNCMIYVLLEISQPNFCPSFHDKINVPEIGFVINTRHINRYWLMVYIHI